MSGPDTPQRHTHVAPDRGGDGIGDLAGINSRLDDLCALGWDRTATTPYVYQGKRSL